MRQASRKTSTGTTVPRLERDAQPGISASFLVLMNKQVRKSLTFNDEHVSRRADVLWGRLSLFFSGSGQKPAASCRVVAFQTTLSRITSVFQAPRHTTQALREPSCRRQGLLKRARPARRSTLPGRERTLAASRRTPFVPLYASANDNDLRAQQESSSRATIRNRSATTRSGNDSSVKEGTEPQRPRSVSEVAVEQFEEQPGPSTTVIAATFVAMYLTIGTLFYSTVESWSPLDALYFVVQAGLNVGYGDIQPTKEISRLFTAAFVLAGNLLLGGALALFVQGALMKQERLIQQFADESNKLRVTMDDENNDGAWETNAGSGVAGWAVSLFSDAVSFTRGIHKVLSSYAKRAGRRLSNAAENALSSFSDDAMDAPRGIDLLVRELSAVGAAFLNTPLGNVISSYSILWLWIGSGTAFGMIHEHLPFADALLFSVSSLSTLGISPPPSSDPVSRLFCTVFLLSGVAVYALTLGRVANFFVDRYEREQVRRLVTTRLRLRKKLQQIARRCDIHDNAAALAWKARMRKQHAELLETPLWRPLSEAGLASATTPDPSQRTGEDGDKAEPLPDEETLTWAKFLEWKLLTEGRISVERLSAIRREFEQCFEKM